MPVVCFRLGQLLCCGTQVKHFTFLVAVTDMKTLLQTWNERLICGYGFVIDVGSGV